MIQKQFFNFPKASKFDSYIIKSKKISDNMFSFGLDVVGINGSNMKQYEKFQKENFNNNKYQINKPKLNINFKNNNIIYDDKKNYNNIEFNNINEKKIKINNLKVNNDLNNLYQIEKNNISNNNNNNINNDFNIINNLKYFPVKINNNNNSIFTLNNFNNNFNYNNQKIFRRQSNPNFFKEKISTIKQKRSLSSNNIDNKKKLENIFEEIKKKYFNLFQINNLIPIYKKPKEKYFEYNYYVNRTYRKQIPLYFKHRLNWHFIENKEEGFNFRWKYYPGKIKYKEYQFKENTPPNKMKMINVFERYSNLGNKEKMFINFIKYCNEIDLNPFKFIPFTIILNKSYQSEKIINSLEELLKSKNNLQINNNKYYYLEKFPINPKNLKTNRNFDNIKIYIPSIFQSKLNYFIVKPPNLLQGIGIKVSNNIKEIIDQCKLMFNGMEKMTSEKEKYYEEKGLEKKPKIYKTNNIIIQKYLDNPLLYYKRKFDIRCYVLVDYNLNVFMCKEGHLKACSEEYNLSTTNIFNHITNYSLQKKSKNFSKYEESNEISYKQFIESLNEYKIKEKPEIIFNKIMNKIKDLIQLSMNSVGKKLQGIPNVLSFQIFGYDFIIDNKFNPWILEINDNPGLEISSKLISKLIPRMIDDALRLTIDKFFETKYDLEVIDEKTGKYKSKYKLDGYNDEENIFEFLCNINKYPYNN